MQFEPEAPTHKTVINPVQEYSLVTDATKNIHGITSTPEVANMPPPPPIEFIQDRIARCNTWMDANPPHAGETVEAYRARMSAECQPYLVDYQRAHPRAFGPIEQPVTLSLAQRCHAWTSTNPQHAGETSGAWYDRMVAAIPECATVFNRPGTTGPGEIVPAPPTPPAVSPPRTAMDTVRALASNRVVQIGAAGLGVYVIYRLLRK